MNRTYRHVIATAVFVAAFPASAPQRLFAADDPKTWTADQKEQFLRTAKITKTYPAGKGVTGAFRVALSDGTTSHDASVQKIDEHKPLFQPDSGPPEMNFRDTHKFDIAAWRLARLLGIDDMTPPSVDRKYNGESAAFRWWIDDLMVDENDRKSRKMEPPNKENWNREMDVMLVFDQLIYNVDRNGGNIQIDKGWHLWMIDHTRSFRLPKMVKEPKVLTFCDRNLLAKMKTLDEPTLRKALEPYVGRGEIQGLLARRDVIVKTFEAKGDGALYDRPARN